MKRTKILILTVFALLITQTLAQTSEWKIDKSHSKIGFTVTHLLISEVDGIFNDFQGTITTNNNNFENALIEFTLKANSIYTDNTKRDNHLKSADFFDADKFPEINFKSTSFTKVEGNNYKLIGDFTMKGITKQIELNVVLGGTIKDTRGNERAGFKISGKINRFDYGLNWNSLLESGGAVVSKEVELNCKIELVKQKDEKK
ncbi:MAG: polyisoprenoid-binding protein [Ignavibacteriales bacterium CG_4_9_14_3_um_filter_30_11]|nr:MAG: polyisoprenoid-binding protein [Ignavibacteriales bacterium CG_4_9_14_3_um_filter_30_11]